MEIYFDRATMAVLRYIRWHPKKNLNDIQRRLGEKADSLLLINLCMADYLVCTAEDGTYPDFRDRASRWLTGRETFWVSPKGKKILEDRFDRLWQWSIPVLISVAALIISALT